MVGILIALVVGAILGMVAMAVMSANGGTYADENIELMIENNELQERLKEANQEIEQERERLQISPYGDDKIDELEQALEFSNFENEQLKKQNKWMWDALMCLPGAMGATVTQEVCGVCSWRTGCEECVIDKAIRKVVGFAD